MEDKTKDTILKWIKNNITYIYFTLAIIFILYSNSTFSCFSVEWNKVIEKIGFISLTSGVFAGVLKSIQFTGLFKEELNKVISGSELLNNRKDLPELWKKISKIIYTQKFPEISDMIEDRILESYLQTKKNHYNEDIIISINIHELTDDLVISYCQTMEYTAILDSENNQSFFNFTSSLTDDKDLEEINRLISLQIDGKELKDSIIPEKTQTADKSTYSITLPLKGQKKFKIFQKMEKKYSLKGENYKLMRFNTLTKNVDIIVSHPENIEVSFFGIGVVKEYDIVHRDIKNTISRRHRDDIILPKQGFGMSFNKK